MKTIPFPWSIMASLLMAAGSVMAGPGVEFVKASPLPAFRTMSDFHVFGGVPLRLALDLRGSEKRDIVLRLFQVTEKLCMPLGPLVEVGEFAPATGSGRLELELPMPRVGKRLELVAQVAARKDGLLFNLGGFRIFVYPGDMAAPLKLLLKTEPSRPLVVFGAREEIRNYLKRQNIDFSDAGPALPARLDAGTLYLGDLPPAALQAWQPRPVAAAVVVFTDDDLLPGVYQSKIGGLSCSKVTLPILGTLDDDPLSQASFIRVVTQTANSLSSPVSTSDL